MARYSGHLVLCRPTAGCNFRRTSLTGLPQIGGIGSTKPVRCHFAPDAQALFVNWLTVLEEKCAVQTFTMRLFSHLSKYRSLMPSLAVLFHLADWAAGVGGTSSEVSLQHAQQAAAWCEYLESHARRVYSCLTTPLLRATRELSGKIETRKVAGIAFLRAAMFTRTDGAGSKSRYCKAGHGSLGGCRWLREVRSDVSPSGGRPSTRYRVNPRVWKGGQSNG
jgi:hypothetical protein